MKQLLLTTIVVLNVAISYAQQDVWQTLPTHFSDVSGIIHAPAKDTLFIHRTDGSLLRSFNGGGSWDSIFIRHDSTHFTEMGSYFVNGHTGFTWSIWSCMYSGFVNSERPVLLKTIDAGLTWALANNGFDQVPFVVSQLYFWNSTSGFAIGQEINTHPAGTNYTKHHTNQLYMTLDGGATWLLNSSTPIDEIKSSPNMISFCDQYTGIMMGREINFNYNKSFDGGFTWATTNQHSLGYNATGVSVQNQQNAFVLANDSLYVSTDSLNTFKASKLPFTSYNNSVMANNASFYTVGNTTYFLTFNVDIYKTSTNFQTFQVSKLSNQAPNYAMAGFGGDVYIYATKGNVYKTSNVTALKNNTSTVTQNTRIFPNPTADNNINITTLSSVKSYSIINPSGTLLTHKTLDNASINISNLTPGIYLVMLYDTNNKYVDSQKLIKTVVK